MQAESTLPPTDIDATLSNREIFNALVYTPWDEALKELERRQNDPALDAYLERTLPNGIPEAMRGKKSMVLFRNVATSNYEIHRFIIAADSLSGLKPLILEYTQDKFNDRNEAKYFLGKLCFHKGMNKNGEAVWESIRIMDFNASNNVPLNEVKTLWGQTLVDFHHELFERSFPRQTDRVVDVSEWVRSFGGRAKDYYKPFFSLFLRGGILFENYLLDSKEGPFTKEVILPALTEIMQETGLKPLIVALEPTHIEGDQFWYAHPLRDMVITRQKLSGDLVS